MRTFAKSFKPLLIATATLLSIATLSFVVLESRNSQDASAFKASDFNAGRIIDDAVFYNSGSMTAAQIQTFLNSKNPYCDTNGSQPAADWGRPDLTRAQFATQVKGWHGPPYTCLRDFKQNTPQVEAASGLCGALPARNNRTAAQIINDVANACNINPQVLLVLLEKEQSLVTDIWPLNIQYERATGFACPDNAGGACNPAYNGFFSQVYSAARQFNLYKSRPNDYNYRAGRSQTVYYHPGPCKTWSNGRCVETHPITYCGGTQLYIQNQATAALYVYTPYQPNAASLNSYPGTGDQCSSYGNRNFFGLFTNWFGSTIFTTRGAIKNKHDSLGGTEGRLGAPISNEYCGLVKSGCYQEFENGAAYWTSSTGAMTLRGAIRSLWKSTGYEHGNLGYPLTDEISISTGTYQQFEKGRIYWNQASSSAYVVRGGIGSAYLNSGGHGGILRQPTSAESCGLVDGGCSQSFHNGHIYWSSKTHGRVIRAAIYNKWLSIGSDSSIIGYPASGEMATTKGVYQQFERGRIYWSQETGSVVTRGGIGSRYIFLGGDKSNLGYPVEDEGALIPGLSIQRFENGYIVWNGKLSIEMTSNVKLRWDETGAEKSFLGHPISFPVNVSGGTYQQFQKGYIHQRDPSSIARSTHGAIGGLYMSLGGPRSTLGFPTSNEISQPESKSVVQHYEGGSISYSLDTGRATLVE